MENKLEESKLEADKTETKLNLMESVLGKIKVGEYLSTLPVIFILCENLHCEFQYYLPFYSYHIFSGTEDLYIKCECGSTPVLSLLGDTKVWPKVSL